MGTIEKRGLFSFRIGVQVRLPDGSWEWIRDTIHVTPDLSARAARKQAEMALARLEADVYEGKRKPDAKATTLRAFSAIWIENHVRPNCSPVTLKNYQHFLASRILPALGDVPLRKLTPLMITEWLTQLRSDARRTTLLPDDQLARPRRADETANLISDEKRARPLSGRTVQHYYDTLSTMLDYAVQWDFLAKNPMEKVTRPRAKKARVHYLTEEQAVQLLRCLHDEPNMCYRSAILLALLCGLRLGEVCELKLSDVDWENGTIDISRALKYTPEMGNFVDDPKTDASSRLIALPPGMMTVLHETRAYQAEARAMAPSVWRGEGWIVHRWDGGQVNHDTPSKWFRKFADAHGFEGVRFHDLRHPYVKHTTKIFSLRLMDFQAQAYPDARRKTRGACQLLRVGQSRSPVRPLCNRKQFSCSPPQSKISRILYAISMRLSGYTSTRSISSSASSVVSVSASKIALDASMRLSCRACSSCFCFACANTAA